MFQMTTSPGPARRARLSGVTPAEYADELREAFETLAWIDRIQAHRVGGFQGHRDAKVSAARILGQQYHAASQLADLDTVSYVGDALDHLVGVIESVRYLREGVLS